MSLPRSHCFPSGNVSMAQRSQQQPNGHQRHAPKPSSHSLQAALRSDRELEANDPTLIVLRNVGTAENPIGEKLYLRCPPEETLLHARDTMRVAAPHYKLPDPQSYEGLTGVERQKALREEWRAIFAYYIQTRPRAFALNEPSTSHAVLPSTSSFSREYSPLNSEASTSSSTDSGIGLSDDSSATVSSPVPSHRRPPIVTSSNPPQDALIAHQEVPRTENLKAEYEEKLEHLLFVKRFHLNTSDSTEDRIPRKKLRKDEIYDDFVILENSFARRISNGDIYQCTVLTPEEFDKLLKLQRRLADAHLYYHEADIESMKEMLLDSRNVCVKTGKEEFTYFSANHYGSLHTTAQKGEFSGETWARSIFETVARFTAFCHRIGVIVRDLTLRKFTFVDAAKSRLQLAIFIDVAVLPSPSSSDELFEKFGCPAYLAPEIWQPDSEGYSGRAADMWSLGVVLFVLLTGRFPFFEKTARGLAHKIKRGRFAIPTSIQLSHLARNAIFGLLMHFPCQRPTADLLVHLPWVSGFTTLNKIIKWKDEVTIKIEEDEYSDMDIDEMIEDQNYALKMGVKVM